MQIAKAKHSKFRNTGILFELLTRQITADILAGKDESIAKTLLFKYFKENKELGREWQLYSFLLNEKAKDEVQAEKYINVVLKQREKIDDKKLVQEKYNLIKEIKETYPIEDLLKSNLKNYKTFASIYKVFEDHVNDNVKFDMNEIIQSRTVITENLCGKKKQINESEDNLINIYKQQSEEVRLLSYKLLIESLNEKYKGKQLPTNLATDTTGPSWGYLTKGFHMDSGATVVTITNGYSTSGQSAFEVGVGSFNSEPTDSTNPYYRLNTRKFTLLAYGGFDGWDVYREYRTNNDSYALGQTGFKYGAASSVTYPTATGWGAFKAISGPNQENWANTDYYAYKWGQSTFANPEATNINVFATPGIDYVNNSNLVEDAIDMIETDRADSIYITTTPDFNMFLPSYQDISEGLIYPQEAVDNLEGTGIDSNYTATYYPWILTRDTVNNTQIYIPATSEVCRNLALTDNIAFPWFASAGYTRGLVNAIRARRKLTQDDRDTLYKGRVNPIATFSDVGTVIWGNKTLQIRESALDRINVRRLLLQARKLISAVAVRLLFEQNDNKVRQDFLDSVNPILDQIRRDRGLIDFRVQVSNTPEDLDSNTLTGKIFLKPTRALEYIDIEFVITPTGASFDDI